MWEGIPLKELTASALVTIIVLMVLVRKLIPERTYKEKCEEADNWRKAYETERDARIASDAQTADLLELGKTTHALMVAVFGNTLERSRQSGGTYVVPTHQG